MPGNELGDRIHNFFVQDYTFQGQQQSQVTEGNLPVSNTSISGANQVELSNSNYKNYHLQNTGSGDSCYPFLFAQGSHLSQSHLRPGSAKGSNEQPNMNGFVYDNQIHQTRKNEANSDQRHFTSSRGISFHELQQHGPDHLGNPSVSSETSASPVSFDLFGGQQQMSHDQQSNMPQFLQPQQFGINDLQQLQQQLMIRKLQELQRHQQMQQLNSRQDYSINQATLFAKQTSGSQSSLVNGTSNSDMLQNHPSAEYDANWFHQGSPSMQGSANGLVFQQNTGQTQHSLNLVPQQFDQSPYGVPVPNSRGAAATQYPQMMADRYLVHQPQTTISSSSPLHGNQHNLLADHVGIQDESSNFRHKTHSQNNLEVSYNQSLNMDMKSRDRLQQGNTMPWNVPHDIVRGKQEVTFHPEASCGKSIGQVASPKNEVALDPEEEKILFGSDDNIWDAFGTVPQISGEPGKMISDGGFLNSLPSIQSGSWSALMQSAVAETSGSDVTVHEQSSVIFQSNDDGSSGRQLPSMRYDRDEKVIFSADDNVRMPSTLNSGSFPPDGIKTGNAMGFNQMGHIVQHESVQAEAPYHFDQPLEESGYRFSSKPLKTSLASQHLNQVERDTKTMFPAGMSGQTGTKMHSDGWNTLASVPAGMDRFNNQDAEKLKQSSQNLQDSLMRGKISSLWEQNPLLSHPIESVRAKPEAVNPGANRGVDDASVANSYNLKKPFNTSPFVQNNFLFNQWRSVHPPATSQEDKGSERTQNQANNTNQVSDSKIVRDEDEIAKREAEKCDWKNSSSDSHHSNLIQPSSIGLREVGSSSANDPRALPPGKQKPTNQLNKKASAHRSFLYHPMGNVDDQDHNLQQPVQVGPTSKQNAQFFQSNLFGQVASNSLAVAKGQLRELSKDSKDAEKETPNRNHSHHALNMSASNSINLSTDKFSHLRPRESQFSLGKPTGGLGALNSEETGTDAPSGASESNNSVLASGVNAHHSPSSSQLNVASQHLVPLRQKKRKNATFGLQPWHKVISDDSRDLRALSLAESDWSKAPNGVTGKVDDLTEPIEDATPVLRSKRRLIISSRLMQQLMRPPPATTLSVDACASYDVVAYSLSRTALEDACRAVSCASNSGGPRNSTTNLLEKRKSLVINGAQGYGKAAQELIGRVTNLENDFLRLEKNASLLDLRIECQDLDKFSIINRFARFHGRGQNDNAESASANTTASTRKPLPQRYVTAVAMPRNLPETVWNHGVGKELLGIGTSA